MRVKWYGHAFFHITTEQGISIVLDPFDATVGYPVPKVTASVVLISHHHYDHNNVSLVEGDPTVIDQPGTYQVGPFSIEGFATFHDSVQGKQRGGNIVYQVRSEEMSILHCGDLGKVPDPREIENWKPVDILLIPVGGIYTISAPEAHGLVKTIQPRVIVPMHFKTRYLAFDLADAEPFISGFSRVKRLNTSEFHIIKTSLPEKPEVWVLNVEDVLNM